MDVVIDKQLYTVEQFDRYIRQRDGLFELVHGEIREKLVTEEHGVIVVNIAAEIRAWIKPRKLGRVGTEISHRRPGDRYNDRLPDVSYTVGLEAIVTEGSVPRMPDLAVEVKSPTNTPRQLREKAEYMLQNGCKLVWLVYPESKSIEVCTLTDTSDIPESLRVVIIEGDGAVDGDDVLPGFSLTLATIFDLD